MSYCHHFLKKLKKGVFAYCYSLASIKIPSSVTTIRGESFSGCKSLKEIELSHSVEYVERYAFENCSMFKYVKGNITDMIIEYDVFEGRDSSLNFEYEYEPSTLSGYRFYCRYLNSIISLFWSYTRLTPFFSCTSLTQIILPSSVTSIGIYAFAQCPSLEQISIPSTLQIDDAEIDQKVIVTRF